MPMFPFSESFDFNATFYFQCQSFCYSHTCNQSIVWLPAPPLVLFTCCVVLVVYHKLLKPLGNWCNTSLNTRVQYACRIVHSYPVVVHFNHTKHDILRFYGIEKVMVPPTRGDVASQLKRSEAFWIFYIAPTGQNDELLINEML